MAVPERTTILEKIESSNISLPAAFQSDLLVQCVRDLPFTKPEHLDAWWAAVNFEQYGTGARVSEEETHA